MRTPWRCSTIVRAFARVDRLRSPRRSAFRKPSASIATLSNCATMSPVFRDRRVGIALESGMGETT